MKNETIILLKLKLKQNKLKINIKKLILKQLTKVHNTFFEPTEN